MAKYRKLPVVIEATRFLPEDKTDRMYLNTLEGKMRVSHGDWIITGIAGEKYPCKDAIFRGTYEPVESP